MRHRKLNQRQLARELTHTRGECRRTGKCEKHIYSREADACYTVIA